MNETFVVGDPWAGDIEDSLSHCLQHPIGDTNCPHCWTDFPKKCVCGGLIHAEFGDDTDDGYWLFHRCEKCGWNWKIAS